MFHKTSRPLILAERAIPLVVFAALAFFTYARFYEAPFAGFEFNRVTISQVFSPSPREETLQPGDRLIQVGPVVMDEFNQDLRLPLLQDAETGDSIPVVVERDGRRLSFDWIIPAPSRAERFERVVGLWWFAYVFWLAGTVALLSIRPKDLRWSLLIAFNYLTAIWLAAGSGPSHWHIWDSALVVRAAVWLSLPVFLHFHWIFPRPLRPVPWVLWGLFYLAGIALAALQWFQRLPVDAYMAGFLLVIVLNMGLLVAHLVRQPADRRYIGMLAVGFALVFLPVLVINLVHLTAVELPAYILDASLLAFPALPGAYFYAVYLLQFRNLERRARRLFTFFLAGVLFTTVLVALLAYLDARFGLGESVLYIGSFTFILAAVIAGLSLFPFLSLSAIAPPPAVSPARPGGLELRPNRLLALYLFFATVSFLLAALTVAAYEYLNFIGEEVLIGVGSLVLAMLITANGFAPFERWVDRRLLGIPPPPTHLLLAYAERINTSLEQRRLAGLLGDELLPALLVRQSALLRLGDDGAITPLYTRGIAASQLLAPEDLPGLCNGSWQPVSPEQETDHPLAWIRLVFPLEVEEKLVGCWLLGRRDPDDLYTAGEVAVLRSVANSTAVAVANIQHTDLIQTLHQTSLEQQEKVLGEIALVLHDEVLNELSILLDQVEPGHTTPRFHQAYEKATTILRQIHRGLRPTMLLYGLYMALEELVDELADRAGDRLSVKLELPASAARYDPKVELHLFRIVQQACENVLRHAHARTIRIDGCLEPGAASLVVQDDGVGFALDGPLDLVELAIQGHFGLVGMYQRASFIGAQILVHSNPDLGTKVEVNWTPDKAAGPAELPPAGPAAAT
jgi:signal transduction histidine kinase